MSRSLWMAGSRRGAKRARAGQAAAGQRRQSSRARTGPEGDRAHDAWHQNGVRRVAGRLGSPSGARSCPMLPPSSESYRAVTAIVRGGMLFWHQWRLPGCLASGDRQHTNLLGMPSAPNGTLPLIPHSPCPDRWASAGTLDSRQARQPLGWKGERVVCERRSGAESCTFCGPLDVDSVGSLAALILGVLLIWRSPAHRLRPLVIAHSSSPNLFPVSPPSRAPSRSRSCHRMRDSSLGENAFFPLWLARLQLGRLLSRLKVGTQGRVAARAARSPRCAVPAHRPAPSDVGSRSAAVPCSPG